MLKQIGHIRQIHSRQIQTPNIHNRIVLQNPDYGQQNNDLPHAHQGTAQQ